MAVRRKHAIRTAVPSPRRATTAAAIPKFHAHGCTKCQLRYADSCTAPTVNDVCLACRTGRTRPRWDINHDPQDCCYDSCLQVDDAATRSRYALGGPGPWWLCRLCSRTHPHRPLPPQRPDPEDLDARDTPPDRGRTQPDAG